MLRVLEIISMIRQGISIYRQKTAIHFLYAKRLTQNGPAFFSILEQSQ